MSSAQVGKTEILNNVTGFYMDQDPSPILIVQPTLEIAEAWSKDRLAPMLRDTPCLRGKVKDPRARDSGNTLLHKLFDGGHITMSGANSPASLASRPIRIVLCDEIDRYPVSAGTEGDPMNLAFKRATTFWNRKKGMFSTPTTRGASRIEAAYGSSDRRKYYVPCPHCGEYQAMKWGQLQWPKDRPEEAAYYCEHCGAAIEDADKTAMLQRGEWRAEGEFKGVAGFWLNELYSPWVSFGQMAVNFIEAKKSPQTLKTFVNTSLAETWEEDRGETVDDNVLFDRREDWGKDIPLDAGVLTCGIDVQGNRLEAEVVAWGRGKESWGVENRVFYGDPRRPDVWKDLDTFLQKTYTHAGGVGLPIACACVDTGDNTQHVYDFVRSRQTRRIYGVKGANQAGLPVVNRPTMRNKGGVLLFTLGVDTAKADIYSYMKIIEPGPGYMHFPMSYGKEYFEQLTAEKVVTRFHKGFPKREWIKTRARNEALDCRVYALAALHILNPDWDGIFENLGKAAMSKNMPPSPENQRPMRPNPSRKKSWINGWRR